MSEVKADEGTDSAVLAFEENSKYNKNRSKCDQARRFGLSCFCPCIVLGEMSTSVSRESRLSCWPCGVKVGPGGCGVCLQTCACTLLGWPAPPLLACYVCLQRRNLSHIYPSDLSWRCTFPDLLCGLCWPVALLQHRDLMASKAEQGILHYPWAYGLPKASVANDAVLTIPKRTLFIVGPPNSGKSTLLRKLCTTVGKEKITDHHMYVDIKVASVPFSNIGPFTLEVWDIPEKFLKSSLPYNPDFVVLTYDSGDKDSLLCAQDIYQQCAAEWVKSCRSIYMVATKIDTWESYTDDDIGPYNQTGAEWRAACIELAIEAEQWSKQNKALHFSLVSNPMNEGIKKLMRSITNDV